MNKTKTMTLPKAMYEKNITYSLTINPEKQFFNLNVRERTIKEVTYFINKIRPLIEPHANFTLYPEISKKGRFHYHGTITIHSVYGFHAYTLPRINNICMFEIDVINDDEAWTTYCTKDTPIIKKYFNRLRLPYPINHNTFIQLEVIQPKNIHDIIKAKKKSPL